MWKLCGNRSRHFGFCLGVSDLLFIQLEDETLLQLLIPEQPSPAQNLVHLIEFPCVQLGFQSGSWTVPYFYLVDFFFPSSAWAESIELSGMMVVPRKCE